MLLRNEFRIAVQHAAPLHMSAPRHSTQRFVFYYTTRLYASPRTAARTTTPRLPAPQRYHLFVTTQRIPHHNSSFRDTSPHPSALLHFVRRAATQRFVCYNASSPRRNTPLRPSLRLTAVQRNDLFVTALRSVPPLRVTRRASTRRGSLHRSTLWRSTSQLYSTICLLLRSFTRLGAAFRIALCCIATQRYHLFVTTRLRSALFLATRLGSRSAPRLPATLLNDLFITPRRSFTPLLATRHPAPRHYVAYGIAAIFGSPQLNATICLLPRGSTLRGAALRGSAQRSSAQRVVTLRSASFRPAPPHSATQLTETLTRITNVQTFTTNFGNV